MTRFPGPTTQASSLWREGNENLIYDLFTDSALTTRVAGTSVLINDTSKPAGVTKWGTSSSDTITGSDGPDRLAGVKSTGTTGVDLGAGQIDNLTGYADSDTFLLGDSRGVFYDDKKSNTLGNNDYASISDFVSGVDKLQVRAGTSYVYTVSGSTLSLYWDRNNNGLLTQNGNNQDELIAVLQGVTSLTNADLVGA